MLTMVPLFFGGNGLRSQFMQLMYSCMSYRELKIVSNISWGCWCLVLGWCLGLGG